jgi:hypothetical protein
MWIESDELAALHLSAEIRLPLDDDLDEEI